MSEFKIILTNGIIYPLLVPFKQVNGLELLRRLSLECEWSYILIVKNKNETNYIYPLEFANKINLKLVPSGSTIKLLRKSPEPIVVFHELYLDKIKKQYFNNQMKILVWLNFWPTSKLIELFFIQKVENFNQKSDLLEHHNWKKQYSQVTWDKLNQMLNNPKNFLITKKANERLNELRYYDN